MINTQRVSPKKNKKVGYWTGNHVLIQTEDMMDCTRIMFPQFEKAFLFDHSAGHCQTRVDGLDETFLNKGYGARHLSKSGQHGLLVICLQQLKNQCIIGKTGWDTREILDMVNWESRHCASKQVKGQQSTSLLKLEFDLLAPPCDDKRNIRN